MKHHHDFPSVGKDNPVGFCKHKGCKHKVIWIPPTISKKKSNLTLKGTNEE